MVEGRSYWRLEPARLSRVGRAFYRAEAWDPEMSLEPHIRRVVAEQLGVGPEELTPEVSLTDELAADSLDILELALVLEGELGFTMPEALLEKVRTYGELVGSVQALVRRRDVEAGVSAAREVPFVQVHVVPGPSHPGADLRRAGWLTPYTVEAIVEDAARSGPGARVELRVPPDASPAALARLHEELGRRGDGRVEIQVERDRHLTPLSYLVRPYAA